MRPLEDYSKIIFLGGGIMAERLYRQIEGIEQKLVGVMDLLEPEKRTKTEFKGLKIQSPECYREVLTDGDTAVIVAIGQWFVPDIVHQYLSQYEFGEENLFVVNPYTTLRFFCIDEELEKEKRISVKAPGYQFVRKLFQDELSLKTYRLLTESKPYDTFADPYEIMPYTQIKDMYYMEEDYWLSYDFGKSCGGEATVIDCGAYIGDSILPVCNKIPQNHIYYYAFEPDRENADCMRNNEEFKNAVSQLEIYEYGVGEKNQRLSFKYPENGDKEGGRFVEINDDTAEALEVKRLDDLNLDIHGTLYIKMDIEGSELGALKGAEDILKKNRPYLAICLYHRKNDLLEIPTYIAKLLPDYKFYLRGGFHTILWAIPEKQE